MALRHLGVKSSKAIFIGDTLETDIIGSRNAGLTSIQIIRKRTYNSIIKPHFTITSLNQLLSICDFPIDLTLDSTLMGSVDVICDV
jgi:FMN phosphatase YigB (HAD superfamily)